MYKIDSSLLQKIVNYGCKKFYNIVSRSAGNEKTFKSPEPAFIPAPLERPTLPLSQPQPLLLPLIRPGDPCLDDSVAWSYSDEVQSRGQWYKTFYGR